jgi:hypothetical protein
MNEENNENLDSLFEELLSLSETIDVEEELALIAEQSIVELKNETMMPVFDEYYGGSVIEDSLMIKAAAKRLKDPKGGLTAAGRAYFKRKEGANLKPGVKGPANTPEKMRRKGSFLTRFFTNPSGPMVDEKGRATRLALSAAAWGEPVPKNMEDAAKLAAKGRRLLERYSKVKKKSENPEEFSRSVFGSTQQKSLNSTVADDDLSGIGNLLDVYMPEDLNISSPEDSRQELIKAVSMLAPSFVKGEKMFIDDESVMKRINKASMQMAKARKKKN